ncbi:MAG: hypothetical protein MUF49_20840 [Oculatellaceae cyanobacterium Prado106]|jgi:porphobilinogen synthase|nr:hypothetical protein [Oculatellaceae cyanobacterium Prado106]
MSQLEALIPGLSPIQAESVPAADRPLPSMVHRPRRLRRTETLRRMVREHLLQVEDLIYPLFVMEGEGQRVAVPSMPGCYRYTLDLLRVRHDQSRCRTRLDR